jgi:hypothetical protein
VIHAALATALQRARRGAPPPDPDDFVAGVLEGMRRDFRDSKEDRARVTGQFKHHVRFFEHEEGLDDGSEAWRARWKETAREVEAALRKFLASDLHARLRALPSEAWIEIEDPSASVGPFFELDGVRVYVKLDCAYRSTDREVTLIDWKAGRTSSPLTPLQLGVYALYLQHVHGIATEDLRAMEVNVLTGEERSHDVGPAAVAAFHDVLAGSVGRMRSYLVDVAANVPRPASAFPLTEDDSACRDCNFRSVCPKLAPAF